MSRALLALAFAVLSGTAAARDAWLLIDIEEDAALSRAQRVAIAEDLGARLAVIRSVVPEQPPDRRARVERRLAELDADEKVGNSSRGRFFLSREYQHYQLLELLEMAADRLNCVLGAEGSVMQEMGCWAQLASVYLAEERLQLGLSTLRRSRLIPRDDDMPRVAQDPRVWYSQFGRGILRGIVTPYLKASSAGEP